MIRGPRQLAEHGRLSTGARGIFTSLLLVAVGEPELGSVDLMTDLKIDSHHDAIKLCVLDLGQLALQIA